MWASGSELLKREVFWLTMILKIIIIINRSQGA